jgi:hypothetical protein
MNNLVFRFFGKIPCLIKCIGLKWFEKLVNSVTSFFSPKQTNLINQEQSDKINCIVDCLKKPDETKGDENVN